MNTYPTEDRSASPPARPPQEIGGAHVVHFEQPQQPYDEDDHSGEIREYNGVFEGPEKTLGESSELNSVSDRVCITCSFIPSPALWLCRGCIPQDPRVGTPPFGR